MQQNSKFFSAVMMVSVVAASGCATTPQGRKQLSFVSEERVNQAGTKTFERMKNREIIVTNKSENKLVRCVVDALNASLEPQRDWEVVIFRDDHANAFAMPGNKIGINSGLLRVAVNQDQLATVLGHEIAHVLAEHGRERMSQQESVKYLGYIGQIAGRSSSTVSGLVDSVGSAAQIGILYPFSQTQENEADVIGLELLARSGFHPDEAITFWQNMRVYGASESSGFFSGHASHEARSVNLAQHLPAANLLAKDSSQHPHCDQ